MLASITLKQSSHEATIYPVEARTYLCLRVGHAFILMVVRWMTAGNDRTVT